MLALTPETGRRLGQRRRAIGLSRGAVATLTGISYRRLSELERGGKRPFHDEVERVSLVLGGFEALYKRMLERQFSQNLLGDTEGQVG